MDTIEEKALNPCYIFESYPKASSRPKKEGLGRILDQLISRFRGLSLITSKTVKLERERERELKELELAPYPLLLKDPIS
jgi:hypothetical protein